MQEEEYIEKIEQLNKRIIDLKKSKEFRTGRNFIIIKDMIRKMQFKKIIKKEVNKIKRRKWSFPEKENSFIDINKQDENKKVVVYTCVTGKYDNIIEPFIKQKNVDYIFFTDEPNVESDIWQVRQLPKNVENIGDKILQNRYIKFHPYELFENEYDYAIYIDGNIEIIGDMKKITFAADSLTGLALHRHRTRNSVFDEAKECYIVHKGNPEKIKAQMKKYEKEGFLPKFGLYECCVIVSNLKSQNGKKILEDWWHEFLSSESYRDQLSLPYVIWKDNFNFDDVGNLGYNVYQNPKFSFKEKIHNN